MSEFITRKISSPVKVINLVNNRSLIVKVNDRGPFKKGRIIDLSYAAAYKLDIISNGTSAVRVEAIDVKKYKQENINFIKNLVVGDEIQLQDLYKEWHYYIVDDFFIINVHDQNQITNTKGLLLITCYPFNAITSGTHLTLFFHLYQLYLLFSLRVLRNLV